MYGSAEQNYYCQMGPPVPMNQSSTMSPTGQVMYQNMSGYDMLQSGDMTTPLHNSHLTVLSPQSPLSLYGSPHNSMPGTPMSHPGTFSPGAQYSEGSDTVSPQNCYQQQRSPQMPDSTNYNDCGSQKQQQQQQQQQQNSAKKGYRGKVGQPYIPSYMDLSNGPEPCVVCSDAATGYHYRCMTCEGCKGFFRRTIQKNLQYHCKWNSNCVIDKTTRNQCQYCRFQKCIAVGMATDLVLNEKQRVAKRKLIEGNRERKREEQQIQQTKVKVETAESPNSVEEIMSKEDHEIISQIAQAYEQTSVKVLKTYTIPERFSVGDKAQDTDPNVWQQLAEVMTPSIVKVVEFAKRVPGFMTLNVDDQILLLKSCCMEIMCLRAACRYNSEDNTLTLQNGLILTKSQLGTGGGLGMLMEPIFDFAIGLAKLKLDDTEIGLLAAVLLMQSDRTGLREPDPVEEIQDDILGAYKRYISENRPHQPVHWAKVLMKVTDLRTISTRHAERVLCIKLDSPGELPPLFLEMFDEVPPLIVRRLLVCPLSESENG